MSDLEQTIINGVVRKVLGCSGCVVCQGLTDMMVDGHKVGISQLEVVNTHNGEFRRSLVVYRKDKKSRPVLLNFCPFCGNPLNREEE